MEQFAILAEVFFYGDIVIGFIEAYFDSSIGEFIKHPKLIAKHYLSGAFANDLLATLHWKEIFVGIFRLDPNKGFNKKFFSFLRYLKLLKLYDIHKVPHILKSLNSKKETKSMYFIFFYILMIFVWVHVTGCFFWYFIRQNKYLAEVEPVFAFPNEFGS